MDKALKALKWVYNVKERALLVVLVVVLCFQVYRVVSPPELDPIGPQTTSPPRASLPAQWDDGPPRPSVQPPQLPPVPVEGLTSQSPFTTQGTTPEQREVTAQSLGLQLIRIVPWRGDAHRAEIRIGQSRQRMDVGDEYQGFRVDRIDPNTNQVDVWSTEHNRVFTLTVDGGS